MDRPLGRVLEDPEVLDRAEKQAEQLLEELKKQVQVEAKDIALLRKELRITVPEKIIADHLAQNYDELMHDAMVPGFRKGRAPRQLIEKRFGADVRESLTTVIIGQSYFAVVENEKLDVLGDPLFQIRVDESVKLMDVGEASQHLKLPPDGDFSYVCEVELKPTFELPELEGIELKVPQVRLTDEDVEAYILRQRKIRGRYEPVTEGAAETDDLIVADAVLTVDGMEVKREDNVQLGVRATSIDGIPLLKLGELLTGATPGETRTVPGEIPNDYERADLRGKAGQFAFTIHELKRLVPATIEALVEHSGCGSDSELRQTVGEDLERDRDELVARQKKQGLTQHLLDHTTLDLPAALSARHTERAVMRRMIELQQYGMPLSDIEAHIDELRTSATEQATRNLKISFILEKVAEKLEVTVTDEEVNTEIARIARLYNRRFDRVRDDLQKRDLLSGLAEQIRQDKCIDRLLETAKVTEVQPEAEAKPAAGKPAGREQQDAQ